MSLADVDPGGDQYKLHVALAVVRSKPASLSLRAYIESIRDDAAIHYELSKQISLQKEQYRISGVATPIRSSPDNASITTANSSHPEQREQNESVIVPKPVQVAFSAANTPKKRTKTEQLPPVPMKKAQKRLRLDLAPAGDQNAYCEQVSLQSSHAEGISKRCFDLHKLVFAPRPSLQPLRHAFVDLCCDMTNLVSIIGSIEANRTMGTAASTSPVYACASNEELSMHLRLLACVSVHIATATSHLDTYATKPPAAFYQAEVAHYATQIFEHIISTINAVSGLTPTSIHTNQALPENQLKSKLLARRPHSDSEQNLAFSGICSGLAQSFVSFYQSVSSLDGPTSIAICDGALDCLLRETTRLMNISVFGYDGHAADAVTDLRHRSLAKSLLFMLESTCTTRRMKEARYSCIPAMSNMPDRPCQCRLVENDKKYLEQSIEHLTPFLSEPRHDQVALQLGMRDLFLEEEGRFPQISESARWYVSELQRVLHADRASTDS